MLCSPGAAISDHIEGSAIDCNSSDSKGSGGAKNSDMLMSIPSPGSKSGEATVEELACTDVTGSGSGETDSRGRAGVTGVDCTSFALGLPVFAQPQQVQIHYIHEPPPMA